MATVKFEYFPIAGAGEKVRLALTLAGIKFEDARVTGPEWNARKKDAKYGQMPVLTLPDGQQIYQSNAMLRWAGAQGDGSLYPADLMQRLKVDEAVELAGDLYREWYPCVFPGTARFGYDDGSLTDEEKKALAKKLRENFLRDQLPRFMGYFADLITTNGNAFMCGDVLTIADLALLHAIKYYAKGIADFVPKDCLEPFPIITDWIARVEAHPPIAEYYASK